MWRKIGGISEAQQVAQVTAPSMGAFLCFSFNTQMTTFDMQGLFHQPASFFIIYHSSFLISSLSLSFSVCLQWGF